MEHLLVEKEIPTVDKMENDASQFSDHLLKNYSPEQMRSVIMSIQQRLEESLKIRVEEAEKALAFAKTNLDDLTGANLKAS